MREVKTGPATWKMYGIHMNPGRTWGVPDIKVILKRMICVELKPTLHTKYVYTLYQFLVYISINTLSDLVRVTTGHNGSQKWRMQSFCGADTISLEDRIRYLSSGTSAPLAYLSTYFSSIDQLGSRGIESGPPILLPWILYGSISDRCHSCLSVPPLT